MKIQFKHGAIDNEIAEIIEDNNIEMVCDENMNIVINSEDWQRFCELAPEAKDDFAIIEHEITDVELTKGNYNRGDVLTYKADGEWIEVTGEFWVKDGILHHTHIFDDDEEVEITTKY